MNLGLVTYQKEPSLVKPDRALIPLFQSRGIETFPVVWNDPAVQWQGYDALIIRSLWDYHLDCDAFLTWLDQMDSLQIPILNSSAVIRMNHHKFYLKHLEDEGVSIVPTIFINKTHNFSLSKLELKNWERAVIKPAVSASGYLTEIFNAGESERIEPRYSKWVAEQDFLVQKFMPQVQSHGELSLMFFDRRYSHCVLKTAANNEFRVQEEFGGSSKSVAPSADIIKQASDILSKIEGTILQARVDGIVKHGVLTVMEIELIEPHLFFEFAPESLQKYVNCAIMIFKKMGFNDLKVEF